MADHTTDLTILKMVLNRLPFLAETENNTALVSNFTLELMFELEPCFNVDAEVGAESPTHVGNEEYYTIPQRAVIADVLSCYILMIYMAANSGNTGNLGGTVIAPANATFIKKAKAGSVEVEYEAFDIKKGGGMSTTGETLLAMYRASAIRKARAMNCAIDICGDCSMSVEALLYREPHHFIVRTETCPTYTYPVSKG